MKIHVPKDLSLPVVPPAVYKASVTGYKVKTSQEGNLYILWEFTLLSQGPTAEVNTVGRKVFDQTTFTEDSLWRLHQLMEATTGKGLKEGDYEVDELVAYATSHILNKDVVINVVTDVYQGQNRTRVREFRKA